MEKTTKKFDYEALLADLEAKKKIIENLITHFKVAQSIAELPLDTSVTVKSHVPAVESLTNDSFFGLDIVQAVKKYLSIAKGTKSLQDITEALEKGGFQSRAKNLYKTIHATLYRQKETGDIVKVKKEWGLKEWYGKK